MTRQEAKKWIRQKFNNGETERLMADLIIQALGQELSKPEIPNNCNTCEYLEEVDGSNCYECVKGIRNNYRPRSKKKYQRAIMTREEAIKRINDIRRIYARHVEIVTENENEALEMAIKALEQEPFDIETYCREHFCVMVDKDVWEKAEKALKQEPILDKIRDEIREFSVVDESGTYRISTYLVDQIIDKYREVSKWI